MEGDYSRTVRAEPDEALEAVEIAAELWDAAWEARAEADGETAPPGGRLHLPVLAGIRRGRMLGQVEIRESSGGSEVVLQVESSEYDVNRPAVLFLALGALGGLVTILLPIYPKQLVLFLPIAIVFMIGAWLLVASKVRTAGPEDFLDTVAELAEEPEEDAG